MKYLNKLATSVAGVTIATIGVGGAAQAVTLNFNFQGTPDSTQSSFVFTNTGVSVTATGTAGSSARNVIRNSSGLGVFGGGGEDPEIDGVGADETLSLSFNQTVRIVSATFSQVGTDDDFRFLVGSTVLVADEDIPGGSGTFNFSSFSAASRTGNLFKFTVPGENDDYQVKSITIETVEAVPEPITMLGAGTALGFGTFFKKSLAKKRKKNEVEV